MTPPAWPTWSGWLRKRHAALSTHLLETYHNHAASLAEHKVATRARLLLASGTFVPVDLSPAPRGYASLPPQPIWLRLDHATRNAAAQAEDVISAPHGLASPTRKQGKREDNDEANRTESIIIHRFESILSWVESMDLNRATDDDDLENARKAAEDQDHITLSKHRKRAATRLRLHLDLARQDPEHERLSDTFIYPERNHRSRSYMPDHTRVLEAEAQPGDSYAPDPRLMARVRQRFQALYPRRIQRRVRWTGPSLTLTR